MRSACRRTAAIVFAAASLVACGNPAFAERRADEGPLAAAVRREGVRLARSSALEAPAPSHQGSNWIVRHPVIAGTLIGAGVGAALSRVDAIAGRRHDPSVAVVGAGAGAWGGLIASVIHKVRGHEKVGAGAKIGIAAGAAALIVLPVLACYGAGGCGGVS